MKTIQTAASVGVDDEAQTMGPYALESAVHEIRRQFEQAYALVSGARSRLAGIDFDGKCVVDPLLDLAEDILAEHDWVNRLAAAHASEAPQG